MKMQLGMIGLGRMGANMALCLRHGGHDCVVFDMNSSSVRKLVSEGAIGAGSLDDFVAKVETSACSMADGTCRGRRKQLARSCRLHAARRHHHSDEATSHDVGDIRRASELKLKGLHYVDVGTSGGVWGLSAGNC